MDQYFSPELDELQDADLVLDVLQVDVLLFGASLHFVFEALALLHDGSSFTNNTIIVRKFETEKRNGIFAT